MAGERDSVGAAHPVGSGRRRMVVYGLFLAAHTAVAIAFLSDQSPGDDSAAVGLPLDDGWIHLVYSRSLASFEGFAYNPGDQEAGFSSPLWAMLLAPLFWLRLPWDVSLVLVVKVVGVLVAWATSVWGCRLTSRLAGRPAGIVLGLLIALDPWLGFAAVSGMEVHLAAATMLAGFDLALGGRWRASGIALALALWSRPETLVVTAVLAAAVALRLRREGGDRGPIRELAVPPLAAGGLWSAWCVATTGRLLPNAFYVKHGSPGPLESFEDLPAVFIDQLLDLPWLFAGSGLVLAAVGASCIARAGKSREVRLALLASIPAWLLAIVWAHRVNEPLAFFWHRYTEPGLPLLLVPLAVGMVWLPRTAWKVARRQQPRTPLRLLAAVVALPLLALSVGSLPQKLRRNVELQAWSASNIQNQQVRLGLWLRQRTHPGQWLMTHDAGAIRFLSDRPVIDMVGINSSRVIDGELPRLIRDHSPRYIAVIPSWYPDLVRASETRVAHRVTVDNYVICQRCDQDEMVVLEASWR